MSIGVSFSARYHQTPVQHSTASRRPKRVKKGVKIKVRPGPGGLDSTGQRYSVKSATAGLQVSLEVRTLLVLPCMQPTYTLLQHPLSACAGPP